MSRVLVLPVVLLGLALMPGFGRADGSCPPPPDHGAALDGLILQLQAARSQAQAQPLANKMWDYWADAPNEQAQAILDAGMRRRAAYDFYGALQQFDRLIAYCPDYAEGYNQRAFVNFLRQDFAAALVDLDLALARSPRHIGALSGRALSLFALGQIAEARTALGQALALNPWLPERSLAAPGGPLAPQARDI